jgi:hypothetical protein
VAAIGTVVVAITVIAKINREHGKYKELSAEKARMSKLIAEKFCVPETYLPPGLTSGTAGRGDLWSAGVVASAALAAVLFSLAVWWRAH